MKATAQITLFSHVSFLDKLLFTKHLSVMIKSGITLSESLDTLMLQAKSDAFKKVLKDILKDVHNGQELAVALKKHPHVFDLFYISLIEIGEESGTLESNLDYLASHLAKTYNLQKKIKGALMYPAIVLTALVVVGIGLSYFVLPKLIDLFSSLDVELPLITKILLFVATQVKENGPIILVTIIVLTLFIRFIASLSQVRPILQRALFFMPAFGKFIENSQMAFLTRNLGIMLKSGLPLSRALEIQYEITENAVFKGYINSIRHSVTKGHGIAEELEKKQFSRISPIASRMIAVGEKTGKLDDIFLYLGDFFEEEVDDTAKNFSTILEPIILLIVGLLVGFVALAIISPIYQITGSIRK